MLIGIISDTHDKLERTVAAVDRLIELGVSTLFHCGDLASEPIVETCSRLPLYFVFGNHDSDMVNRLRDAGKQYGATCLEWGGEVELDNRRIGMTHGHLSVDLNPLMEREPDYLFSGHSHEPNDWTVGKTRRINPGALHRARVYTVATLELSTGQLEFIEIS